METVAQGHTRATDQRLALLPGIAVQTSQQVVTRSTCGWYQSNITTAIRVEGRGKFSPATVSGSMRS